MEGIDEVRNRNTDDLIKNIGSLLDGEDGGEEFISFLLENSDSFGVDNDFFNKDSSFLTESCSKLHLLNLNNGPISTTPLYINNLLECDFEPNEIAENSPHVSERKSSFNSKMAVLPTLDLVLEGILGLTMLTPNISVIASDRIIIRTNHASMDSVKLLSGCSGRHGPLLMDCVCYGMLTAAVYGDCNGAPTPKQILVALRELRTPQGIIIIVKNDLDERLNFGLAMERARSEGIIVDMILVSDDCWEHQSNKVGRRCLTGFFAIIKVAGAMSEAKKSMKDIYIMCRALILTSLSIAYELDFSIKFGTDIKGNGGQNMQRKNLDELIREMILYMIDSKKYFSASIFPLNKFIVIINSYCLDKLLIGSLAKKVRHYLTSANIIIERLYCGTFALGPNPGFCITLVKDIDEELLPWFDVPIPSRLWPENCSESPALHKSSSVTEYSPVSFECNASNVQGPSSSPTLVIFCKECIIIACKSIISSANILNKMDPDGCYGSAVANGASALYEEVKADEMSYTRPFILMNKISKILEESISGATGTMYGLFFTGICQAFLNHPETEEISFDMWANAIKKGINTLSSLAYIKVDECTLLDALFPFYRGLANSPGKKFLERLEEGVCGAESGAKATALMKSSRHTPSWPEPGAQTVATIVRAIYETAKKMSYEMDMEKDKKQIYCPVGIVEHAKEDSVVNLIPDITDEIITIDLGEEEIVPEEMDFESEVKLETVAGVMNLISSKKSTSKESFLDEMNEHNESE